MFRKQTNIMKITAGVLMGAMLAANAAPVNVLNTVYASQMVDLQTDHVTERVISGSITNLDFSNFEFLTDTDTKKEVDKTFLGRIDLDKNGGNAAELIPYEKETVLQLKAMGKAAGTYCGTPGNIDLLGVEFKVRFSDTTSQRSFLQMKGKASDGNYAWPTLLTFKNDGTICNAQNEQFGTYEADTWYTIKAEIDTIGQTYRVWMETDNEKTPVFTEGTLNTGGAGDHIWRGLYQNKFAAQNAQGTDPHFMEFAYVRAGEIKEGIEAFNYQDMKMKQGDGAVLMPAVLPENAFAEGLQYHSSDETVVKVFENGLLAVGTGDATITVNDTFSGKSGTFQVIVEEPDNVWEFQEVDVDTLNNAVPSFEREQINYSGEEVRELFRSHSMEEPEVYRNMSDEQFVAEVEKDIRKVTDPTKMENCKYEQMTRYLVLMYRLTDDWEYARKAGLILYHQAMYYPHILLSKDLPNEFKESQFIFGEQAVFSFGYLLEERNKDGKTVWEDIAEFEQVPADEIKETIAELYLRPMANNCIDRALGRDSGLNNIDVYGARTSTVAARILNDPYLARKVVMLYDDMMDGKHYYSDGMWEEGTFSYGDQVWGNILTGIDVLKGFCDPEGYEDPENPEEYGLNDAVMGIVFDETDLTDRWPLLEKTKVVSKIFRYPDGTSVPINDTHPQKELSDGAIQEELLENIEFPGFGYYGLVQGNSEGAVHAGLTYQALEQGFAGSHTHTNILAMDLWGAGTELLPDTGYIPRPTYSDGTGNTLRYPSMRPVFHNMPWIFRNDGKNEGASREWNKPRLLAYDNGQSNGDVITLVEASEAGPDGYEAEKNQRLLMNVALDDSHSYVFDLSRVQGEDAHLLFQRGSELEDMESSESIEFTDTGKDTLLQTDTFSAVKNHSLIKDMDNLYEPKEADGSNDFSFTWTGEESGSRITTHMNGVEGSEVYLSMMPTPRRINTKEEEKIYRTPHLTRYSSDADTVTKYGAVHEAAAEGEENLIEEVEWLYPDQDDTMGIVGKITTASYIDYIYISGDTEGRTVEDIEFAGNIAMVRKDRESGEIAYSYVYGDGKAGETVGIQTQDLEVTGLTTQPIAAAEAGDENTITVKGVVDHAEAYIGTTGQLVFGDGSGYGVKIKEVRENEDSIVFVTEDFVPVKLTDTGVETLFYPCGLNISGNVSLILKRSTIGNDSEITGIDIVRLPDKTIYEVGEQFDPSGMVVVASSSNADRKELSPDEYKVDDSQFDSEKPGIYPVTVSYTPDDEQFSITYEASFHVTVVESFDDYYVSKIKVAKEPDKLEYETDEELDPTGLVVERYRKASPSNAKPVVDVLDENEYELDYDFSTPGRKKVVVSHEGIGKDGELREFTDSFMVTVQEPIDEEAFYTSKIKVTSLPKKRTYEINEELDPTGMEVTAYLKATASDASRKKVLTENEYDLDYDFQTPGKKKVKVSYWAPDKNGEEKEFKDSFTVTVKSYDTESDDDDSYVSRTTSKAVPSYAVTGTWSQSGDQWMFRLENGETAKSTWICTVWNGSYDWFWFDENGTMKTGWQLLDGKWYYMNEQHDGRFGAMVTGWKEVGGTWYYFNEHSDGYKGCMLKEKN